MRTPVLVIAYSRPDNLESLLSDLEKLSPRDIHISIDGTENLLPSQNIVFIKAKLYESISKHNVTVDLQDTNLGLLRHFELAFHNFFCKHEFGIIFEDDIEFRQDFIDFVDSNGEAFLSSKYWSICGHNPNSPTGKQAEKARSVYFFETTIHTIWGWATSRQAVFNFLNFMQDEILLANSLLAIKLEASRLSLNPLFRAYFRSVWRFKLLRNLKSTKGYWDNYWVLAGWYFNRNSLMSSESLTTEGRDQSKNQSHLHVKSVELEMNTNLLLVVDNLFSIRSFRRRRDQKLLGVWGIHKNKSVLHALRKIIIVLQASRNKVFQLL